MLRKAFVMPVHPSCHDEYLRRHSPIWPALAETLKAQGAHNYAIWLDAERSLLFASVEIESEARWEAIANTEICQRWWMSMKDLMPSNPDNSPISAALKPMFLCLDVRMALRGHLLCNRGQWQCTGVAYRSAIT